MRQLNRLKKQRRPFNGDAFYIYEGVGVYQFRDANTHLVISSSPTLGGLTRHIVVVLNRYKHYDAYLKAISSLSEKAVSSKQKTQREKEYKKYKGKYSSVIHNLIKEYYLEQEEAEFKKQSRYKPVVHIEVENRNKTDVDTTPHRIHRRKKSRL